RFLLLRFPRRPAAFRPPADAAVMRWRNHPPPRTSAGLYRTGGHHPCATEERSMSTEKKFIDGLIFKAPHENAPDYVIAKISIKRQELIAWLQSQEGEWI